MKTWKRAFTVLAAIVVFGFIFTGCKTDVPDKKTAVKSVTLDPVEIELTAVGEEATLIATVLPKNASNKTVTWYSDKQNVATVDQTGKVKAVGKGEATVTVTTKNGKKASCVVTVNLSPDSRVAVTGVTVAPATLQLKEGQTELLTVTIAPPNATNKGVTWTSSDSKKATVSNGPTADDPDAPPAGTVKAVAEGTATITVKTEDGDFEDECEVTVNADPTAVTGVTLATKRLDLIIDETVTLTASVVPAAAKDNINWTTGDAGVATVADGLVTAVGVGNTIITVASKTDGNIKDTCFVSVTPEPVAVTGVTLNKSTLYLAVGTRETLTATITPENAHNKNVTWESSNSSVARVSGDGVVTGGITSGTATTTITVTSADGNFKATCTVAVVILVTGVSLDTDTLVMLPGSSTDLNAIITPSNATIRTVTWESSNTAVATVSVNGRVTAVALGDATITATTEVGGKTAICAVAVISPSDVYSVTVNKKTLILAKTDMETLYATITPSTVTNKAVTWSSSDTTVATVGETTGKVTAVGVGTANITATSVADGGKKGICPLTVIIPPPTVGKMAWVNSGTFRMGAPEDEPGYFADQVLHPVTFTKGFYMGKYEVTQGEFLDVMGYNNSRFSDPARLEEFPVENINWHEAILYCNKRSMAEGLSPVYTMYKAVAPNAGSLQVDTYYTHQVTNWEDIPGNWSTNPADWGSVPTSSGSQNIRWAFARMVEGADGYRLPTDAEWEYACRAGTLTAYNFGNTITPAQANYSDSAFGKTVPVGGYQPNDYGLYDMHGNVAEWCWDWYSHNFPTSEPLTDPIYDFTIFMYKRMRGGSWSYDASRLRSAFSDTEDPSSRFSGNIGLRVMRYIEQ